VMEDALILTLDPAYFKLTGGFERWLYRLVRKHGGRQVEGWRFELRHLHLKSGSLQRYADFCVQLRRLVHRQSLPGYWLSLEHVGSTDWLRFRCWSRPSQSDLSTGTGDKSVDKLCPDSGITRTAFGESPAIDTGNHTCASTASPCPATVSGFLNSSN
jgi:plasmid replication initiation protein